MNVVDLVKNEVKDLLKNDPAHDFQHVESLPRQLWDIPLDAVITEACIYTFNNTEIN